jgi:hypothetical protein
MQEANDRTLLNPKKSNQYNDPKVRFFYPLPGLPGKARRNI